MKSEGITLPVDTPRIEIGELYRPDQLPGHAKHRPGTPVLQIVRKAA